MNEKKIIMLKKVLLYQVSEKCNLIKFIIFVHVAKKKTVKNFFSISLFELTSSIVITPSVRERN